MAAAKKPLRKPEPVAKQTICSVCGLDWAKHGSEPTLETCVTLLKAALAARPNTAYANASGSGCWPAWVAS